MITKPHLFFAEVSLDLSRDEFQSGIEKLELYADHFTSSYLFHLLYAKALLGLGRTALAGEYFRKCCAIAPANQVAWRELASIQVSANEEEPSVVAVQFDPVMDELEQLSAALMNFEPMKTSETSDPTSIVEQKKPFSDDTSIAVPTETLANLFTSQGAYKKAIKIYTYLIQLKPQNATQYQEEIDSLLEHL
jgi:tetratricopeptide (TPR) repeat protein